VRYMVMHYQTQDMEDGIRPSAEQQAAIGEYMQEAAMSGVLLAGEGVASSSQGARVEVNNGKVRVIDRKDGVQIMVSGSNLPPNQYRVSFNRDGNCSSPNGFSAGPPWAPPGMDPYELIPLFWNPDGNAEGSAFIRGVHTTGENGVAGRSVVIYWGSKVTDAYPDVPNNRAACGVFEPAQLLLF